MDDVERSVAEAKRHLGRTDATGTWHPSSVEHAKLQLGGIDAAGTWRQRGLARSLRIATSADGRCVTLTKSPPPPRSTAPSTADAPPPPPQGASPPSSTHRYHDNARRIAFVDGETFADSGDDLPHAPCVLLDAGKDWAALAAPGGRWGVEVSRDARNRFRVRNRRLVPPPRRATPYERNSSRGRGWMVGHRARSARTRSSRGARGALRARRALCGRRRAGGRARVAVAPGGENCRVRHPPCRCFPRLPRVTNVANQLASGIRVVLCVPSYVISTPAPHNQCGQPVSRW